MTRAEYLLALKLAWMEVRKTRAAIEAIRGKAEAQISVAVKLAQSADDRLVALLGTDLSKLEG